jgi:hypothetical protein
VNLQGDAKNKKNTRVRTQEVDGNNKDRGQALGVAAEEHRSVDTDCGFEQENAIAQAQGVASRKKPRGRQRGCLVWRVAPAEILAEEQGGEPRQRF